MHFSLFGACIRFDFFSSHSAFVSETITKPVRARSVRMSPKGSFTHSESERERESFSLIFVAA